MWLVAAVLGGLAVLTGVLPLSSAYAVMAQAMPVLAFLIAVTVLAELAEAAEVFDLAALHAARLARGRTWVLFAGVVVLATVTTVVLSLDTTAVLLTPVALSLARQVDVDPMPFAFATVWLANTASLLLPVSNLTNLLATAHLGLTVTEYAGRMLPAAVASVVVTAAALGLRHHRQLRGSFLLPPARRPEDPVLFVLAAAGCILLVPALLAGLPAAASAGLAALPALAGFLVRRPAALRAALVPWRLVLLVAGLFLVVAAVGPHGLDAALRWAAGSGDGLLGRLRLVGTAALGANLANNLPAYLALDRVVPPERLFDLLLGVNLGPLVLPWGSLATLLWLERCRSRGLQIPWRSFTGAGLLLVPPLLAAATLALRG